MPDRLVIFDCDGVLVDNEAVWKRIADEMAAELGIVLTEQDHERYCGVLDVDMYADLSRRFGVALPDDLMQRLQAVKVAASHTEIMAIPGPRRRWRGSSRPACGRASRAMGRWRRPSQSSREPDC